MSNLVAEVVKSGQIKDRDGYDLVSSGPVEITGSNYLHTMHDLIQSSKCDFTILENFGTCEEIEELQPPLMVISGSRDSSNIYKLSQIYLFSQNHFLCMVSLDVDSFLKYVWYFIYNLINFNI